MAQTYAELRRMSTEEVIQGYDQRAERTQPGLDFYRDELRRRELDEHSQQMLRMTDAMRQMTADIRRWTYRLTWLTILMAVVAVLQLGTTLWWKYDP
jgi:hypothetical protein